MMYPYRYAWHPRGKYKNLYRQRCRVLARGAMNSALVEFRSGRREMVMEMITSALSYMPEIGGIVKHRTLEGELWLRVRFDDALIEIANENETVSFRLVPILVNPPASIGTLENPNRENP